jgi:hypothetical protein
LLDLDLDHLNGATVSVVSAILRIVNIEENSVRLEVSDRNWDSLCLLVPDPDLAGVEHPADVGKN